MKLAIFGDSFGDDHRNWKNRWLDVGPSWIDYLRQYHDVDNYSFGGSSLYYSKRVFDKVDLTVYDKIIFLITANNRRFQIWPGNSLEYGSHWNFRKSEFCLKNKIIPELMPQLLAMDLFFKYIYNESDNHFHDLMIQSIKNRCPNDFIIPVDPYSSIGQLADKEVQYFGKETVSDLSNIGFLDARKCHLSEENNLILGQHINQCLLSNVYTDISTDMFVNPTQSFDYYFRKR